MFNQMALFLNLLQGSSNPASNFTKPFNDKTQLKQEFLPIKNLFSGTQKEAQLVRKQQGDDPYRARAGTPPAR